MIASKQLAYPVLFCIGLLLLFLAYKINEDNQKQVYIQQHAPLLKLPIVDRFKGLGTLQYPNKLYVRYQQKTYPLNCSNRFFHAIAGADSVLVHYDLGSDRAVLAHVPITRAYGLLVAIALGGLLVAGKALGEIRQQLAKKRIT